MKAHNNRVLLTSEVARRAGVSCAAVRLWEKAGLLRAQKTAFGVRLFSPAIVERFLRERAARRSKP